MKGGDGCVGGGQQSCAAVPMRTDLTSHCHQLSCCLSLPLPNLAADGVPAGAKATTMELVQGVGTVRFVCCQQVEIKIVIDLCKCQIWTVGDSGLKHGGAQVKWQSTVLSPCCLPALLDCPQASMDSHPTRQQCHQ